MLTDRQKAGIRLLTAVLKRSGAYKEADGFLIVTTACIYVEMRRLQAYVNKYGTTYEIVNKSGEVYTKHRPEHQQLTEARSKLLQMLKELGATPAARKRVEMSPQEVDPLTELLATK